VKREDERKADWYDSLPWLKRYEWQLWAGIRRRKREAAELRQQLEEWPEREQFEKEMRSAIREHQSRASVGGERAHPAASANG
jgi:hypothetical protein